jgi:acyl-CoA synthetase (AMP-forming)/AMP-acid ligase II
MTDDLLRHPLHSGHLTVGALKRNKDKPVMYLGDTTLTGGEVADRISQYIQAFEALGAGTGVVSGLLALNRPEVLMILGAGQTQGYRRLSLHPLGSLDDHAYVLNDAGVTSLTIDPNPMFVERAKGLLEKVPGLKQVLTIGPVPEELAEAVDRGGSAAGPHRRHGVHGRDDRKAEGRHRDRAVDHHHDDDSARRVGVARTSEILDVHTVVACRGGVLRADDHQGRRARGADQVRPGRGAENH